MYLNTYELENLSRQVREQRMSEAATERMLAAGERGPSLLDRVKRELDRAGYVARGVAEGLSLAFGPDQRATPRAA